MYNTRGVILVKGNSGAMYMDIAVKIIISVIVCSLVSLTILGILDNVYIKNSTLTLEKNQNYANNKDTYNTPIIDGNIIDVEEENEEEEENPLVLFNLADNGENYENWTVESGVTKTPDGLNASLSGISVNPAITQVTLPVAFRASTTYTLVFDIKESSSSRIFIHIPNYRISFGQDVGLFKIVLTTNSELSNDSLILQFVSLAQNQTKALSLYGIYEGNQTDNPLVDVPQPYGSVQ